MTPVNSSPLSIIVLAAGKGTRMASALPKVLHKVAGLEMIGHVMNLARAVKPKDIVVVLGEDMDAVKDFVQPATIAIQHPPRGTGDALRAGFEALGRPTGTVLMLYADTPLLQLSTLEKILRLRQEKDAAAVVLGFHCPPPSPYGRLIRNEAGTLIDIIENKDCTREQADITLCNSGIMAFDGAALGALLPLLQPNNKQGEFYATDLIRHAHAQQHLCLTLETHMGEALGINSRHDLALVEHMAQHALRQRAMAGGATLIDPDSVYFSYDTQVGKDVIIEPSVFFGAGVVIDNNVTIKAFSHLEGCTLKKGACVGPFARVRGTSTLGADTRIGNFVEIKNAQIADGAKVNHLSYVGDAVVGKKSNIGAGVITANYDGFVKSHTTLGDNVSVGSNVVLVAPVSVGDGAIIGAGSTITDNIAKDALAIARADQFVISGGAEKFRQKRNQKKP